MDMYTPTKNDLELAHKIFEENEPRDLFYRAATELVTLAIRRAISLSVAEALAVLLQTWNRVFYRYRTFNSQHFSDIKHLIASHDEVLMAFRQRTIEGFCHEDEVIVQMLFEDFEKVLGPVGAAKCLHLLAPYFFPLWDRSIANAYGLGIRQCGKNANRYCRFMKIVREQTKSFGGERAIGRNPLKALDEYNYCKYTKRWI